MFRYDRLVIVAVVAAFSSSQADTIYVDANCPGGDGSPACVGTGPVNEQATGTIFVFLRRYW